MQARKQDGADRHRRQWEVVALAAAVVTAIALAYPTVSSAFHLQANRSAPAPHVAALTVAPPDPAVPTTAAPTDPSPTPTTPARTTLPRAATGTASATGSASDGATGPAASRSTGGTGSANAPLAGRLRPGETRRGVATFYQGAQNTGACSFDPSPDHFTAAMNWKDYEGSNACGAYVQVRGSGGATVTVRITNLCPYPCRIGQLDLDPEAYRLLAPLATGETPITWKLLSPGLSGGIALRYKTGSSQWWCGIQVINHRNPIARLEVRTGGGWTSLPRADYNYFLSAHGAGCGAAVRVTDIYGQRLVVGPLPVRPDVTQPTTLQFTRH